LNSKQEMAHLMIMLQIVITLHLWCCMHLIGGMSLAERHSWN
jgi:hypothetical protein